MTILVILDFFNDRLSFVRPSSISYHQPLALAVNAIGTIMGAVVLDRVSGMTKHTGKKLQDTVNSILVLLVALARCESFLPEMLVRRLQLVQGHS